MKLDADCIACCFRQIASTVRQVTDDEEVMRRALVRGMEVLRDFRFGITPAEVSTPCFRAACEVLGVEDPYLESKRKYNRIALEMAPRLKDIIRREPDPLFSALLVSSAGNIIDLGINRAIDIEATVRDVMRKGFARNGYAEFKAALGRAKTVLFIGDNAGEIVFDKLLIQEFPQGVEVVYVVRGGPIVNDSLIDDARYVAMEEVARVITTGSSYFGVLPKEASEEFWNEFHQADMVIAKGHANFETVPPRKNLFCILTAKCEAVARELGVDVGDVVLALVQGGLRGGLAGEIPG